MSYVWIIASRYLRSKRRLNFITLVSLLATGGVLTGVAALTIVLSVMNGFEDQVQQRIAGTNAHVAVLGGDDRPLDPSQGLELAIRKAVPEAAIAPFVYGKVMVASRHSVDGMVLTGVDPKREPQVTEILARLTPSHDPFGGDGLRCLHRRVHLFQRGSLGEDRGRSERLLQAHEGLERGGGFRLRLGHARRLR